MPPGDDRPEHSVAMLGAPTSGKTTFLAALSIALTRQGQEWKVVGADEASTQVLVRLTTALIHDHAFPPTTALGAIEHYRWLLVGPTWRTTKRRWFGSRRTLESVKIGLDLADASGELAKPNLPSHGPREELIENLIRSRGIVFLFDPISEFERGDAFYYFFSVLAEVAARMIDTPECPGGSLPHYVAVCISKFDELRVLTTAEELNLTITDPDDKYNFPRVHDDDAREFFAHLCKVSRSGDADLVMNTLKQYFRQDRIKYFVTSAIGFYVDPQSNIYNSDDIQNQLPNSDDPNDKARIRGTIHPINVVEPLMWIGKHLAKSDTL